MNFYYQRINNCISKRRLCYLDKSNIKNIYNAIKNLRQPNIYTGKGVRIRSKNIK